MIWKHNSLNSPLEEMLQKNGKPESESWPIKEQTAGQKPTRT